MNRKTSVTHQHTASQVADFPHAGEFRVEQAMKPRKEGSGSGGRDRIPLSRAWAWEEWCEHVGFGRGSFTRAEDAPVLWSRAMFAQYIRNEKAAGRVADWRFHVGATSAEMIFGGRDDGHPSGDLENLLFGLRFVFTVAVATFLIASLIAGVTVVPFLLAAVAVGLSWVLPWACAWVPLAVNWRRPWGSGA